MTTALIVVGIVAVAVVGVLWVRHALRCKYERIHCAKGLPDLAEALGLEYTPPRRIGDIMGTLGGEYEQYEIELKMDQGSAPLRISRLGFESFPASFRVYKPYHHPEDGWVVFDTGDPVFDQFFKTRHVSILFAETIRSIPEILETLGAFVRRWAPKVYFLEINPGWARGGLKIAKVLTGEGEELWQPVDDLREFIPDLVHVLDTLQKHAPPRG